jgi:glycosyltransferase involved in cell wall biosynthesis
MQRIAFLLSQSLETPSGLGRYWPIAKELVRLGHQVTILALHHNLPELDRRHSVREGVTVHYVGQMHVRRIGPRKVYYGPGRLILNVLASITRLAYALARLDVDLVQICKAQPTNTLAARLGGRGRSLFCDCDDYESEISQVGAEWQRAVLRNIEDGIVHYAKGLTVNTRFTLGRYSDLGFPTARIVYVPNGVERSRFTGAFDPEPLRRQWGLQADDPLVVYLGTLGIQTHSTDLLLTAFRRVAQELPRARLLLVGGGEGYDEAGDLAQQLGIADRTVFTGYVPPEDVPCYLALGTVSVDPIRDDVIARARSPLKVVESLAMGVPVVTGNVGDRQALLGDDEPGVLVPPGDSQALAAGLLTVLRDRKARARMAEAALARRELWYWDRLIHDFAQIYEIGR